MQDPRAEALSPFSEQGFRHLAQSELSQTVPDAAPGAPDTPSDFDLSPELIPEVGARAACSGGGSDPCRGAGRVDRAADPAHRRSAAPRRTDRLSRAASMEPTDGDPIATALREAQEEIGLDRRLRRAARLSRRLPHRNRLSHFSRRQPGTRRIHADSSTRARWRTPSRCRSPFSWTRRTIAPTCAPGAARERRFYAMPFEQRYIWGATAGIMKNMHKRLFSA